VRNSIRQLRRERNWSLRRLSELSGVPLNTICRMETGGGTTLRNALRIASAFELSVYQVWETLSQSETDLEGTNTAALTVRDLRTKRGWRLYDLSNASRVSMSTVASVEKGRLPTLKNALRIASAFGVSVHEIWRHADAKQPLAQLADEFQDVLKDLQDRLGQIPVSSEAKPRSGRSKLPKTPRYQRS
jgi:transcriptional regulator with XRE-family HTH domain